MLLSDSWLGEPLPSNFLCLLHQGFWWVFCMGRNAIHFDAPSLPLPQLKKAYGACCIRLFELKHSPFPSLLPRFPKGIFSPNLVAAELKNIASALLDSPPICLSPDK